MRVRATTCIAEGRHVFYAGDEFDVSEETGLQLLRAGFVERVASIPETAALNRGAKAVRVLRPVR